MAGRRTSCRPDIHASIQRFRSQLSHPSGRGVLREAHFLLVEHGGEVVGGQRLITQVGGVTRAQRRAGTLGGARRGGGTLHRRGSTRAGLQGPTLPRPVWRVRPAGISGALEKKAAGGAGRALPACTSCPSSALSTCQPTDSPQVAPAAGCPLPVQSMPSTCLLPAHCLLIPAHLHPRSPAHSAVQWWPRRPG